jgi:diadenosine tetraphosphate (Ap4A) HIT family hydrolase
VFQIDFASIMIRIPMDMTAGDYCPICASGEPTAAVGSLNEVWVTAPEMTPLRGYVCLVCKLHVREPFELPVDRRAAFWRDVDDIAAALVAEFEPRKLNYEIHGNTIPHLHVHLYPRYAGDPFEGGPIDPRRTERRSADDIAGVRRLIGTIQANRERLANGDA